MGFIPARPPPKSQIRQPSDDSDILLDDSDGLIDVAEVSQSAYCNRMDLDNGE